MADANQTKPPSDTTTRGCDKRGKELPPRLPAARFDSHDKDGWHIDSQLPAARFDSHDKDGWHID